MWAFQQQDSDPCHVVKVCKMCFQDKHILVLEWPGNSPDINTIENLWCQLKQRVEPKQSSNKIYLIEVINESWYHIITVSELKDYIICCEGVVST